MKRKKFWSDLFERYINPDEEDYEKFVEAELLYRIDAIEYEGIDNIEYSRNFKKYKDYHNKLKGRWNGGFVV